MKRPMIATALLLSTIGAAQAMSTGAEIRAALVGNTFQGGMGGGVYSSFFGADGMYKDKDGGGKYTIEGDGVCYPGTTYGCYQATIIGNELEWFKDGKSEGKGTIVKGDAISK